MLLRWFPGSGAPSLRNFAFLPILLFGCLAVVSATKPNLLFIYLDDFGWRDAGFMGSDFYETPNLDRLASEGMVFTNAYSNAANCAPARASLLSGQYTPRHRIFNVGTKPRGDTRFRRLKHIPGTDVLNTGIRTWAQCFQAAGYRTGIIGKWHLSRDPLPYGFDLNIGGTASGSPPNGYYPPNPAPNLEETPEGVYLTDYLSERAVRFIENHADRPWCLYLSHFAVHFPLEPKKELLAKYQSKRPGRLHHDPVMATMVQAVDDGVGLIIAKLEALGLVDDTIIVFTSDNGGFSSGTDMAPLRGYKGTFYEGGIREPFFIKWPGVVEAGSQCHTPIIGMDLFPTFAEMFGFPMPADQACDGVSLLPLLTGAEDTFPERPLFWHFPVYLQGNGGGTGVHSREQRDPLFRTRPCGVVRLGDWKLIQYFEDGTLELYNLKEDISEANNLAPTHSGKAAELLQLMEDWRESIGAPIPAEPNPLFDAAAEAEAISAVQRW